MQKMKLLSRGQFLRKFCAEFLTIAALHVLPTSSFAYVDLSLTGLMRSYTPGFSLNPMVGYSQPLWGNLSTPWYGFVRPYAIGVLSPSVYEGKVGLEVFPISILGLDIRRAYGRRFVNTKNQNCDVLECQGELSYTDLSLQSFFGFEDLFGSIRFTRTFFDGKTARSFPVYELGSSVLLSANGDVGDYWSIAIGRRFIGVLSGVTWGILHQRHEFAEYQQNLRATYFFVGFGRLSVSSQSADLHPLKSDRLTVGIGSFQSSRNITELSLVASYLYSIRSAIGHGR